MLITQNMLNVAIDNVRKSFELMIDFKEEKFEKLQKNEDYINYLNKNIVDFTTNALSIEFPIEGSQTIGLFLKVSADLERVGDHAVNIALRAKNLYEENRHFSHEAMNLNVLLIRLMLLKITLIKLIMSSLKDK